MDQAEAIFFAHPFWIWIALGGVFLIGELMTGSGWLLWPAGAAAATAVATTLRPPLGWPWQIVLFVVMAIVATYLGRRFLPPAGRRRAATSTTRPRGWSASRARRPRPSRPGCGRVFVDGKEWAAELDGGGELAAKSKVEVTEILGGARLKVRAG